MNVKSSIGVDLDISKDAQIFLQLFPDVCNLDVKLLTLTSNEINEIMERKGYDVQFFEKGKCLQTDLASETFGPYNTIPTI